MGFLSLIRPYAWIAAMAVVGMLTGWAYLKGREDGSNAEIAKRAEQIELVAVTRAAAIRGAAEAIANITITHQTIRQAFEREIIEKPVYRECVHDPRVLQLLNDALSGGGAFSASSSELPDADADG